MNHTKLSRLLLQSNNTALVGAIWAESTDGSIGNGDDLLWHLPEDMKYFSQITKANTVIMGRKTWDSLPEKFRPLPHRKNIVISNTVSELAGAKVFSSIKEAIKNIDTDEVWFIGGGQIYAASLSFVSVIKVTEVKTDISGEVKAPKVPHDFTLVESSEWLESEKGLTYRFLTYSK